MKRRCLVVLVLMISAAFAQEPPPFLYDQGFKQITRTSTGWQTVDANGNRREWTRNAAGWSSGDKLYTTNAAGYSGAGKRYTRQPYGWSSGDGRAIYLSAGQARAGTNTYRRTSAGYVK